MTSVTRIERLRDKANSLPLSAGVYIMKNADGDIIYIGKSKKLKNRVTSYFAASSALTPKTVRMVAQVEDFEYILCSTEIEALALENTLIKKHTPKYNIRLKDAKSYPYIKVTDEPYPRLTVTRERQSDKARYFGPYSGTGYAHGALEAVVRIFSLPTCKRSFPKDIGRRRPCIYRDMGRCIAPCTGKVSEEEYRRLIACAEAVLGGKIAATEKKLVEEMELAAENTEFERAAALRDSIFALRKLKEKQKVVANPKVNRDVFALYSSETVGALAVLSVRGGALVSKKEFILSESSSISSEDKISLIADYYDVTEDIPQEIMLDFQTEDDEWALLSEYLSFLAKRKIALKSPERGEGRALCDMARKNAEEAARQHSLTLERENKSVKRLAELLSLPEYPKRIEAYDISNIGDESIVASMVVLVDGKPKKSDYRLFTIKTTGGADDYGSMREALSRRFSHLGDATPSLGETPDLILLDGGVGQVSAVREVMKELGIEIPLFGMVKDDYHKTRAIVDGEREISIAFEMNVYTLVYNLQEEAHRFAVKSSQRSKIKTLNRSSLEKIPGIGESRARALLNAMPLAKIRTASVEELSSVKGISRAAAAAVYDYYHKGDTSKK